MSPHNHIMPSIYEKGKDWGPGRWSGVTCLLSMNEDLGSDTQERCKLLVIATYVYHSNKDRRIPGAQWTD